MGVLLTSAEELGLAGARAWVHAWAQDGRAPGVALNCDGVDDRGTLALLPAGTPPAALLAEGTSVISNCPDILDVPLMAEVLRGLGATVELDGDVVRITSPASRRRCTTASSSTST